MTLARNTQQGLAYCDCVPLEFRFQHSSMCFNFKFQTTKVGIMKNERCEHCKHRCLVFLQSGPQQQPTQCLYFSLNKQEVMLVDRQTHNGSRQDLSLKFILYLTPSIPVKKSHFLYEMNAFMRGQVLRPQRSFHRETLREPRILIMQDCLLNGGDRNQMPILHSVS